MVYCGKPSKGCSNCRERKIRCDQKEPGCGQCEKRQQQCPGYRNLVDLMFRDESSHVIRKATSKSRKNSVQSAPHNSIPTKLTWSPTQSHRASSPAESERAFSRSSGSGVAILSPPGSRSPPGCLTLDFGSAPPPPPPPPSPPPSQREVRTRSATLEQKLLPPTPDLPAPIPCLFSPNVEDRGLHLFVARYVTVNQNCGHLKYDFAFDLWTPPAGPTQRANDPVLASVTAVGLQGIAQMTQARQPLDAARKSYGRALRLINAALRDPVEAFKDSTMLSVLVLGLYERMAEPSLHTMRAWQQHITGAAALARMRGPSQFRSKAAIRMFMMLCQNTMINCIQNGLAMPPDLIELRKRVVAMIGKKEPNVEICTPIYKILQLEYDIKHGIVTELDEMLGKFHEAEDDFERTITLFPPAWQYQKYRSSRDRPEFFQNVCHVYPSIGIATIWNGLRTCRLLILETMLEELHKRFARVPARMVPPRYQIECTKAKIKMEKMALAILASAPQHFGLVSPSDDSLDTLAPVPNTDNIWPEISDDDWEELLGDTDGSDSGCSEDDGEYCRRPSLGNPMQLKDANAKAERFMLLASVTNGLVWPLYLVGMSTVSDDSMKAFVVDRLHAIHAETGLAQAAVLANIVENPRQHFQIPKQRPKPHGLGNPRAFGGQRPETYHYSRALPA